MATEKFGSIASSLTLEPNPFEQSFASKSGGGSARSPSGAVPPGLDAQTPGADDGRPKPQIIANASPAIGMSHTGHVGLPNPGMPSPSMMLQGATNVGWPGAMRSGGHLSPGVLQPGDSMAYGLRDGPMPSPGLVGGMPGGLHALDQSLPSPGPSQLSQLAQHSSQVGPVGGQPANGNIPLAIYGVIPGNGPPMHPVVQGMPILPSGQLTPQIPGVGSLQSYSQTAHRPGGVSGAGPGAGPGSQSLVSGSGSGPGSNSGSRSGSGSGSAMGDSTAANGLYMLSNSAHNPSEGADSSTRAQKPPRKRGKISPSATKADLKSTRNDSSTSVHSHLQDVSSEPGDGHRANAKDEDDRDGEDGEDGDEALDDATKRKQFLERNRIAAIKCRQRKKQYVDNLRSKVEYYMTANDEATSTANKLQGQLDMLKSFIVSNTDVRHLPPQIISIIEGKPLSLSQPTGAGATGANGGASSGSQATQGQLPLPHTTMPQGLHQGMMQVPHGMPSRADSRPDMNHGTPNQMPGQIQNASHSPGQGQGQGQKQNPNQNPNQNQSQPNQIQGQVPAQALQDMPMGRHTAIINGGM